MIYCIEWVHNQDQYCTYTWAYSIEEASNQFYQTIRRRQETLVRIRSITP